jgi:hypothetical protein
MGMSDQRDRFVVITDQQPLRNLVVMWRDEIPTDWQPIAPGRDPRIACEIPADFGDARAKSTTEQSVAVAGYSSIVVDNRLQHDEKYAQMSRYARVFQAGLAGGDPNEAPRGAARIDWDPQTRTCRTVWGNPTASFPNGIPMISRGSDLVLGNSLEVAADGTHEFGVRALDFATGEAKWFVPGSHQSCGPLGGLSAAPMLGLPSGSSEMFGSSGSSGSPLPVTGLDVACENGYYSGMTMSEDGTIYTGTFQGMSRFVPATSVR